MTFNPNGLTLHAVVEDDRLNPTGEQDWVDHLTEVYFATFRCEPSGDDEKWILGIAKGHVARGLRLFDATQTKILRGSSEMGFRRISS